MLMKGTGCQHWQKPAWQPGGTGWILRTQQLPTPLIPGVQHHVPWALSHCHTNPDHVTVQQAQPRSALTHIHAEFLPTATEAPQKSMQAGNKLQTVFILARTV